MRSRVHHGRLYCGVIHWLLDHRPTRNGHNAPSTPSSGAAQQDSSRPSLNERRGDCPTRRRS